VALQDALADAGIAVVEKHMGKEVRLVGLTRAGKPFAILLTRIDGKAADKTAIGIQWDRAPDESMARTISRTLALLTPMAEDDTDDADS
jgi:hypothetical protein